MERRSTTPPDPPGARPSISPPSYTPAGHPPSATHRASASASSLRGPLSPHVSSIPRPKTTAPILGTTNGRRTPSVQSPNGASPRVRQPMGLKAAFQLAEEQEARERSDEDASINLRQAFNLANAEANRIALGSPSPAPRSYRRRESVDNKSNHYFGTGRDNDLGRQLQKFDRNHQLDSGGGPLDGLFVTKPRVGPKVAETAHTLARKASNSSLEGSPDRRRSNQRPANSTKAPIDTTDWETASRNSALPSADFAPLPPVEFDPAHDSENSPVFKPTNLSPEKSYNWHLDADFTAGDLQVSDSPRIKLDKNKTSGAGGSPGSNSSPFRRSNDKLEQIRELEIEAANADISDHELVPRRPLTRLDEIRAREMEAHSPRALAESRLDEIRAQNAEARSHSQSPENPKSSRHSQWGSSSSPNAEKGIKSSKTVTASPPKIDRISPDLLAVTSKSAGDAKPSEWANKPLERLKESSDGDSYDLLRRLARATSQSPPPKEVSKPTNTQPKEDVGSRPSSEESQKSRPSESKPPRDLSAKSSKDRLVFSLLPGLRRAFSSDSLHDKRRSLVNSESDPTDRIEAEMKLFAPQDNYSEKSSTRATSPGLSEKSEPTELETPRPKTIVDALTQPTPRVVGAYVDTPATVKTIKTVKVEKDDDWVDVEVESQAAKAAIPTRSSTKRGKQAQEPKHKREGSDTSEKSTKASGKPIRRRSRSLPGRRRPLINTAKIPTVKEDLRAILARNDIDDSTLDDFDGLLDQQEITDEELERAMDDAMLKLEEDLNAPGLTDRERELQTFDRMSKSLRTGLLGIRSAKQGIERLEGKVAKNEPKDASQVLADLGSLSGSSIPMPRPQLDSVTYLYLPLLYRRQPRFKLTPFGILSLVLAVWYIVESVFCYLYVEPYECPPNLTCDWSPHEPYYPYATPFMLDEWATGGKGRSAAWRVGEELGDLVAEVSDWVTGSDFRKRDEMYMNVWQRKRHRRRLEKQGLIRWIEPVEFKEKFKSWRDSWDARQTAIDNGEPEWGDEAMGADERIL
jgi:hypothetical protein